MRFVPPGCRQSARDGPLRPVFRLYVWRLSREAGGLRNLRLAAQPLPGFPCRHAPELPHPGIALRSCIGPARARAASAGHWRPFRAHSESRDTS